MNKSILITGCSSGIGYCAATVLKQRGYRVFASARKTQDVEKLKAQGFESILLDVNDTESMRQALQTILSLTGGTLDALFNNAGCMQVGAVEDLNREADRAQFETNVFGPIELTRLVLPIMHKQGYGRIIQNSSILGYVTIPFYGAYNASKFALEGYSLTLRQELANTNIHVAIINPGPIESRLQDNAYSLYQEHQDQFKKSFYQKAYKKLEQTYFKKQQTRLTKTPDVVVKLLIHALESKHPRIHYYVGFPATLLAFLKRILPEKSFNYLLTKAS